AGEAHDRVTAVGPVQYDVVSGLERLPRHRGQVTEALPAVARIGLLRPRGLVGERAVVAITVEADDVEPVAGGVARVEDGDTEDLDATVLRRRGFFEERRVAVERDDGEVGVQPGAVGAAPDARGRTPLLVRP